MAAEREPAPALLIFHGDEEDISRRALVQQHLYAANITSFVFDFSGYGASTGRPRIERSQQDGLSAYAHFVALTPAAPQRYVHGFSLGSAVLPDVATRLQPPSGRRLIGLPGCCPTYGTMDYPFGMPPLPQR